VLVALDGESLAGFLRFVTQQIGPPDVCPPLLMNGEPLIEAKILAFGVPESYRRRGIGTRLQRAAIDLARELGCYQLRSWSLAHYTANHALKLKLGFAAQPEQRANGQQGFYFVLPLK
jgi:GNAT superfamily N-acetyltransferase